MNRNFISILFLPLLFSCSKKSNPTADKPSQQQSVNITVDGNERRFVIYLPNGFNNAGKMPLLFAIHGGGGTPEQFMATVDFRPIADREKFIVVYPAGIQDHWNDGRPTQPNVLGISDVSFFNQLCDYLINKYPVDPAKIYATGISNGGMMSSRLGCELSNRVAAIAVVAATIEQNTVFANCNPGNAVPAIYIHGTLDGFVPFNGGVLTVGEGGTVVSHLQAVSKWVLINNCNPVPVVTDLPDIATDGTTIKESRFTAGINNSEVVSYIIFDGGHTWPLAIPTLPEWLVGKTSQDMNASEVIWQFFKRFHR